MLAPLQVIPLIGTTERCTNNSPLSWTESKLKKNSAAQKKLTFKISIWAKKWQTIKNMRARATVGNFFFWVQQTDAQQRVL